MNVERMRRYAAAGREAAERAERERARVEWLAALTSEHRARHEAGIPMGFCSLCLNDSLAPLRAFALSMSTATRRVG